MPPDATFALTQADTATEARELGSQLVNVLRTEEVQRLGSVALAATTLTPGLARVEPELAAVARSTEVREALAAELTDQHLPKVELTGLDVGKSSDAKFTSIPPFDADGRLPPGTYSVSWKEFASNFLKGPRRKELGQGMLAAMYSLKDAGAEEVQVGGSFVSSKLQPGDFDMVYLKRGVRPAELEQELRHQNLLGKRKYGGDIFMEDRALLIEPPPSLVGTLPTPDVNFPNLSSMTAHQLIRTSREGHEFGVVAIDLSQNLPPRHWYQPYSIKELEKPATTW